MAINITWPTSWQCVADGATLVPHRWTERCSCGHTHDHLQGECPTCGWLRVFQTGELTPAVTVWNANHATGKI